MAYLQHAHEAAYDERARELAFLTNALMSWCALRSGSVHRRARVCGGREHVHPRARALARAVAAACARTCGRRADAPMPDDFLAHRDLVTAFEVGWSIFHEDVTQLVVQRLVTTIDALRCTDAHTRLARHALARQVRAHRDTPWLASDALDVIAILDMPAWTSLIGLFGECPVVRMR